MVVAFVDNDQPKVGIGQKQSRTGADDHLYPAFGNRRPGVRTFALPQTRMPAGGTHPEPVFKTSQPLRRQRNLGHQNQHLAAVFQNFRRGLKINFRLAAAGHAVQKRHRKTPSDFLHQSVCRRLLLG